MKLNRLEINFTLLERPTSTQGIYVGWRIILISLLNEIQCDGK